jgi:hypothetical protein
MILYLGENQIDDEGAQHLADMLKNNTVTLLLRIDDVYFYFLYRSLSHLTLKIMILQHEEQNI